MQRRTEIEAVRLQIEEAPVLLHPKMADYYRLQINRLMTALNASERPVKTNDLLRSLIDRIVFMPDEARKKLKMNLFGDLPGIWQIAQGAANPVPALNAAASQVGPGSHLS